MKITKSNRDNELSKMRREIANKGCDVCPCCGEKKHNYEYIEEGQSNKGISGGYIVKNWCKGLFKMKYMQVDCYKCYTCGAEWESDPYEV